MYDEIHDTVLIAKLFARERTVHYQMAAQARLSKGREVPAQARSAAPCECLLTDLACPPCLSTFIPSTRLLMGCRRCPATC